MEYLYRTAIPQGDVLRCMAWSGLNLIALSVSVEIEGYVDKYERYIIDNIIYGYMHPQIASYQLQHL